MSQLPENVAKALVDLAADVMAQKIVLAALIRIQDVNTQDRLKTVFNDEYIASLNLEPAIVERIRLHVG
jgi:hypothetical protein